MNLRWALIAGALLAFILVPFALFGAQSDAWAPAALEALRQRPLAAAAFIVALLAADVVAPVPSSVVGVLAGVLLGVAGGALAAFVGLSLGCAVGYALGASAGRRGARGVVGEAEVARLDAAWARWGDGALIVARPVPVLAEASVVLAGMGTMPLARFAWLTSLANAGVALGYAMIGAWAPDGPAFFVAFTLALVLPGLGMLAARRLGRVA